jgi:hypothetical protein
MIRLSACVNFSISSPSRNPRGSDPHRLTYHPTSDEDYPASNIKDFLVVAICASCKATGDKGGIHFPAAELAYQGCGSRYRKYGGGHSHPFP